MKSGCLEGVRGMVRDQEGWGMMGMGLCSEVMGAGYNSVRHEGDGRI